MKKKKKEKKKKSKGLTKIEEKWMNELTTHPDIYENKTLNKQIQVNTGIFFNLSFYEI